MVDTDTRGTYIEGLRAVATLLDNHPDLPLPHGVDRSAAQWYIHEPIETVLALRDLLANPVTAPYPSNNFPVEVSGTLAGFAVSVLVARQIALDGAPAYPPAPMNPRLQVTS